VLLSETIKDAGTNLYSKIAEFIESLEVEALSLERKLLLQPLIAYIQQKTNENSTVKLIFVCTHNSRRSHLAQVWAQTMAAYYDVDVLSYSGGTEATALFPMVTKTLQATGFQVQALSEGKNPIYSIKFGEHVPPILGFSKTFDHEFNPTSSFAAVMTCSQADKDCPLIFGAEKRFAITYEDPKAFDETPMKAEKYWERSLQIATELKYVFQNLEHY